MTARVSMLLKTRASLTGFRACFLLGRAKDLSAPRYVPPLLTDTHIVRSAHTVYLSLCGSENQQRLFPYTALTDWFV